jgi:hypothetical protein
MSSKIEALPLPQGKAFSWPMWPMALLAALVIAAGVAGYFALGRDRPATTSSAAYESSGVVTGSGPALAELAEQFAAYQSSGPISGTGPGLAELAQRFAEYRNSSLIGGTGPALAEIRGVDVIGISRPGFSRRGPGAGEDSPAGSGNIQPVDTCLRVHHGPC